MTATSHPAHAGSWASVHRTLLAVLIAAAVVAAAAVTMLAIFLTRDSSPAAPAQQPSLEDTVPQNGPTGGINPQYCSNWGEPVPC